jgi:hypothetical protein
MPKFIVPVGKQPADIHGLSYGELVGRLAARMERSDIPDDIRASDTGATSFQAAPGAR